MKIDQITKYGTWLAALVFLAIGFAGLFDLGSGWSSALCLLASAFFFALSVRFSKQTLLEGEQIHSLESESELLKAEIAEQKASVDMLADGLNISIFICDSENHVIYANRTAMDLFRFDSPRGRSLLAVTLSPDLDNLAKKALASAVSQSAEVVIKDPVERTLQAVVWKAQEKQRTFLSIYDITDLRRLERIRRDFVANVSHELRTPLSIIQSLAETLLDEPPLFAEEGVGYLEKIISEIEGLTSITNDLLVLSAVESTPIQKYSCDIADICRLAVQRLEAKARDRGLTLNYEGPQSLMLEASETQVMQAVINLLENAINYTHEGGATVKLDQTDHSVRISVSDTGMGISSEFLERIFERFYRVDKGRSRSTGGTGLGLSIVKNIAEAHGGKVSVVSSLNHGSTFTIELPAPHHPAASI